jgi:hypothetical protein
MVRYLAIYDCIYCSHRQLRKREGDTYKNDPYCCYGDGKPIKLEKRGFNSSVPHWCPLPTALELLAMRLR